MEKSSRPAAAFLAVTALGSTIDAARERAYQAVSQIHFEGCHYRRDIAVSATDKAGK